MKASMTKILYPVLLSLLFLTLPYVFSPFGFPTVKKIITSSEQRSELLSYLLMLSFFFCNYYILIPKYFLQKKIITYLITTLFSFIIMLLLIVLANKGLFFDPIIKEGSVINSANSNTKSTNNSPLFPSTNNTNNSPLFPSKELSQLPPNLPLDFFVGLRLNHLIYIFLTGFFVAFSLRVNRQWRETQKQKLQAELSYLKAQINPHFLFNTLNSIYSLAIEKSNSTAEAIVKLSSLMRYAIHDAQHHKVPLTKEVNYIMDYINLQKLRLDKNTQVTVSQEGNFIGKEIAPLLLITFIENAFKYGINPEKESLIDINIAMTEKELHFSVFNYKVQSIQYEESEGGIGVKNAKARLLLLYPKEHELVIINNNDSFKVNLTLTLT